MFDSLNRIITDHATPVGRRSAFATHVLLLERGLVLHDPSIYYLLDDDEFAEPQIYDW